MFINFSNHPSARWSAEQTAAAIEFGDIVDLPFPDVPAGADTAAVSGLADEYCARILSLGADVVLVQGEMSLSFAVAGRLQRNGAPFCARAASGSARLPCLTMVPRSGVLFSGSCGSAGILFWYDLRIIILSGY